VQSGAQGSGDIRLPRYQHPHPRQSLPKQINQAGVSRHPAGKGNRFAMAETGQHSGQTVGH
jgi:hypothetical protein